MSKKIKRIRRFNQNYKNFNFSDLTTRAEEEYIELSIDLNENGDMLEEVKFTPDKQVEEKNSFAYDGNGKLISHTLLYAVDDVTEKKILTRNEKGLLLSETKFYGSDAGEKTEYGYNDKDQVISIRRYDEEGEFISHEDITYEENGSLKERRTIDAANKQVSRFEFSTPEKNKVEESEYNEKNELVSKTNIIFNDEGKELNSVQTNPQGKIISRTVNTYDDHGNIVEKINKDFYSKKVLYVYNEKNQLISQEIFDETGILLRKNMYDYDEEGNVITEQNYEMDTTRGGRDKHFGTRYEYEFFD